MHVRAVTHPAVLGFVVGFAALAVLGAVPARGQVVAQAIIEPVAHSGDPAPGIPDAILYWVGSTRINAAGNVMFFAFLDGPGIDETNYMAIYYGIPGDVAPILWMGQPAPDMPEGVIISSLLSAGEMVSEGGWIVFTADLAGPGTVVDVNDRAVFVGPPGDLRKVLQGGDQAPGCEPGVYIDVESPGTLGGKLSDNGTLFMWADLAGTGVTGVNDQAFWIGTRDNLELAYRKGMQAPGCNPGVVFAAADYVAHNDAGQISFRGALTGPGVTSTNNYGHWLGGPGTLTKIARAGDPVPGMDQGVIWKTVANDTDATNWAGHLGEPGIMQGTGVTTADDYVLFVGDIDGLDFVAREGDPAPEAGSGVYFESFGQCLINNRREAFYRVKYKGVGITDANKRAMYLGPLGAGQLTLRDGDPAPAFPPDVTLSLVGGMGGYAVMNDVGDIIGPTEIAGPGVTEDDKVVLWLRHRVLQCWVPLLRSGSSIGGRTVYAADASDFAYAYSNGSGGADGYYQSMNDQSMLAMVIQFTDGTHGVFRISPPPFGDGDGDADVDLADWSLMAACWAGAYGILPPECDVFDLDWDGDVDLADQRLFLQLFEGS